MGLIVLYFIIIRKSTYPLNIILTQRNHVEVDLFLLIATDIVQRGCILIVIIAM